MIFHENRLQVDDSHEIPCLICLTNKQRTTSNFSAFSKLTMLILKKQQHLKLSSAANY